MGERGPGPPLERVDARRPLNSREVEINPEASSETGPRPSARHNWLKALPALLLMSGLSGISAPSVASAQSEALSALSNLGYAPGEAAGAVAQAAGDLPEATTAELIRAALKHLAPKG